MKHLLKKSDRALYLPFAVITKSVSDFFEKKSSQNKTLIIRPGGMGDLVLLDLALKNLGIPYDDCHFVIESRAEAWAHYRGMNYSCYDSHPIQTLKNIVNRFRLVINSEQLFGLAQSVGNLAAQNGARKIGFSTNRARRYFTETVTYDPLSEHELRSFEKLLSKSFHKEPKPNQVTDTSRNQTLWVQVAGTLTPERALSSSKWIELIQGQIKHESFEKIAIGFGPGEKFFAEELYLMLKEQLSHPIELFTGSFDQLCESIKHCKRVFTVDSGIVHVCSFLNTPVTTVFTSGRSSKWLPLSNNARIIQMKDLPCQPCTLYGQTPSCPNNLACHNLNWNEHMRATR